MIERMRKSWLLGAVAAGALLAACGGKKDSTEVDASPAQITKQAEVQLDKIELRKGDAAKAGDALGMMSLADGGSGRLSYADSSVDGAKASYSNVVVMIEDDASLNIGKLDFEGLDVTDAGANFARMTMSDITIVPAPEDAESGALSIAKIELMNPSPELAAFVASLLGSETPNAFPDASALTFDAATLSGLNFKLDEGSEDVTANFGDIKILGYSRDKVGLFQLSDISFDAYNGDADERVVFSVGDFSIQGGNKMLVDAFVSGFESGMEGESFENLMASSLYADPTDPGFDTLVVEKVSFAGEGVTFEMPSLAAAVTRNDAGKPTRYVTAPYSATLAADPNGGSWGAELAGGLGMLGYEKLEFSGEGLVTFDPANDTATYEKSTFTLKDGFTIDFTGKFGGLKSYGDAMQVLAATGESMDGDPEAMMEALSKLSLFNLQFTLKDDSIVDRVLNLAATQSGEDPEAMRNQIVAMSAMAPMMAAQSGIDPAVATEMATAVSNFIKKPGTLTISLSPKAPITAQTFTAPEQITKDALGLTATAK